MKDVKSENIVRLYDYLMTELHYYLVVEYCD